MTAVSQMVGLGWGWVSALGNPGTVQVLARSPHGRRPVAGQAAGAPLGSGTIRTCSSAGHGMLGLSIAAVDRRACLLWRAKGAGTMRAMGLTLLAVVFLGPTVQPWYLAWSVVVLATIAEHRSGSW